MLRPFCWLLKGVFYFWPNINHKVNNTVVKNYLFAKAFCQKQLSNRREIVDFHSLKDKKRCNIDNMRQHVFPFYDK